ncbi:5'/3'-nucleotidase SurE [Kitasatospora sp. NPDC088264]|uniref:5'/3'-nucleotidase SurE n=1 Tax=Kitasatospora sp. NPDC088264 TaxID=3155296 RepID=UPI00344255F3
MRVLVTNDDGAAAEGLHRLAAFAADRGMDVLAAAPEGEASGSGTSRAVPADGLVRVGTRRVDDTLVHTVAGPPALIVTLACQGLWGEPPDLVLSGINPGANLGSSVLHSGTVGAALTAARFGRPGVAVSIDLGAVLHWQTALLALAEVLPLVEVPGPGEVLPAARPPVVLNVNAPNVPPERLRGVRAAGLADDPAVRLSAVRIGPDLIRIGYQETGRTGRTGTTGLPGRVGDVAALAAGYATVTALSGVRADPAVVLPVNGVRR